MLDKYALFAVTCSLTTLEKLIDLVEAENAVLQTEFDDGRVYTRRLVVSGVHIWKTNPFYLVSPVKYAPFH